MNRKKITRFWRRLGERGATAIEYGLVVAIISLVIITSLNTMGSKIVNTLNTARNAMN
jgi:pilus assembly protein Flp/PilA